MSLGELHDRLAILKTYFTREKKPIALKPTDFQPSKAETKKKVRIPATSENLAKAMVQDVKLRFSSRAE